MFARRCVATVATVRPSAKLPACVHAVVTPAPLLRPLTAVHTPAATSSWPSCSSCRTYRTVPGRVVKARRKKAARELRQLLKFAERYDPMRTARMGLLQTLTKMGWPHAKNVEITNGVTVDAALEHKFLGFHVLDPEDYHYSDSGDLVLSSDMVERAAVLASKGWKLAWIPHDKWADACNSKKQHEARRELLLDVVLPLSPFDDRLVL